MTTIARPRNLGSRLLGIQAALVYAFFYLPILVLVPEPDLACWREVTGGEIAELPCEAGALRRWWRERLVEES